ncbi:kinase-like domain-containing protein [Lyophyllum atratum]|nr:kinase-like domain-containing protein [Lyophyllum atratum]
MSKYAEAQVQQGERNLDSLLQTPAEYVDIYEQRVAWWDSDNLKSWFSGRGYTLYTWIYYEGCSTGYTRPPHAEPREEAFPYAHQGGKDLGGWSDTPPLAAYAGGRVVVVCAQDSQGRHVAIKAMKDGTEEYRVLRYLHEQGVSTSMDDFEWGDGPDRPIAQSTREILRFIHCLLKGLRFLHKHRIVHMDIKLGNILVNHFGRQSDDHTNMLRQSLRSQNRLTYALFDFDCSTMFPQSYTPEECRLPYQRSWRTLYFQVPSDTSHGEPDFDPFAFDVGMLGVMFCHRYQHLTPKVPMLAPLFDRMITRNIPQRFTAAEALLFFEEQVYPQTTESQLEEDPVTLRDSNFLPFDFYDRWGGLDPSFVEKWAAFREPPVPWRIRVLRFICYRLWGYRVGEQISAHSTFG